jgi:hypothetical protein
VFNEAKGSDEPSKYALDEGFLSSHPESKTFWSHKHELPALVLVMKALKPFEDRISPK